MRKLTTLLFSLMAVPAFAAPCLQGLELEIENHKVIVSKIYGQDRHYSGDASVTVDGKVQDVRWNEYSKYGNLSVELPGAREATISFDTAKFAVTGVKVLEPVPASDDAGPDAIETSYRVQKAGSCTAFSGSLPCFKGLKLKLNSANIEIQSLEQDTYGYFGKIQASVNGQPKTGVWSFQDQRAGMRIEMSHSLYYVIEFAPRTQEILATYQEVSTPTDDHDDPTDISRINEKFQIEQKGQCFP